MRRSSWTADDVHALRKLWPDHTLAELATRFRCSVSHIKVKARALGLSKGRQFWTEAQIETLRRRYPHERSDRIAEELGLRVSQVHSQASLLGLKKTAEFLASPDAGRIAKGDPRGVGARSRWKPGHKSGLGKKRPGAGSATSFQPGATPHNTLPVGTYRVNADGYLDRKISDLRAPAYKDWERVHRLVWIERHGPVPEGHVVVFRLGMFSAVLEEITIDRLECITQAELMRRNTIHNYPPELRDAMRLVGRIRKKIREQEHQ